MYGTGLSRLHNEYFPHARGFPDDAASELQDILIHAIGGA